MLAESEFEIQTSKTKTKQKRQMPVPYGSKLSIPPTNDHLLAGHQEQYKTKQNKKQKQNTIF